MWQAYFVSADHRRTDERKTHRETVGMTRPECLLRLSLVFVQTHKTFVNIECANSMPLNTYDKLKFLNPR